VLKLVSEAVDGVIHVSQAVAYATAVFE